MFSFLIDSLDHLAPVGIGPFCNKDKSASWLQLQEEFQLLGKYSKGKQDKIF